MKSLSVITIVKESKALFLFVLLSIITHISVFLINPTFSFTFSDRWEEQKTGLLMVELRKRNVTEPPHRGAGKSVPNETGGFKIEKRGIGNNGSPVLRKGLKSQLPGPSKAGAPPKEGHKIFKSSGTIKKVKDRKGDVAPLQNVQGDASATEEVRPLPAEKKGQDLDRQQDVASFEPATEHVKEEDEKGNLAKPLTQGNEAPLSSAEEGEPKEPEIANDAPQPKEAAGNPAEQPVDTTPAQPPTDPQNEEAAKADIKENAAEPPLQEGSEPVKPDVLPPAAVETIPMAPEEMVETHISQGLTAADEDPPVSPFSKGGSDNNPPLAKIVEMGAEGPSLEQGPSPTVSTGNTPEGEKSEVSSGGFGTAESDAPPADRVLAKSVVIEKAQVKGAKEEGPERIVEQKIEAPAKKKTRPIRLHKMLEPEKDPMSIGMPLDRPIVKITNPSKKKVSERVQRISGRMRGNGVSRVNLSVNGDIFMIPGENGQFHWDGVLKEGKNIISATVWDRDGYSAMDRVDVEVLPVKSRFGVFIDEPVSGESESIVSVVKGRVEDPTVDTVRVILNGETMEASVEDGGFEKTVLFKEGENFLEAEATNSGGSAARSDLVKVMAKGGIPSDIQLRLMWEDMDAELTPTLTRKERSRLEDEKATGHEVGVSELMSANEGYREKVFTAEEGSGVYTLSVSGGRGGDCTLVVTVNSSKRRVFEKKLMEGEVWVVGRFLMPEGVFWDEDEWFSGKIEDRDSIIKYKSPEGITWKELKVE